MSSAKDVSKRAIETIKKMKPGSMQSNTLSGLIAEVKEFVEVVRAEAELAKELPQLERELKEKQQSLSTPDLDRLDERELQRDIADISDTIQEANKARRGVEANRSTLRALQTEVEQLRSAINAAL